MITVRFSLLLLLLLLLLLSSLAAFARVFLFPAWIYFEIPDTLKQTSGITVVIYFVLLRIFGG